jgi:hypothetical protein
LIFRQARVHGWVLIATPYVIGEVLNNLPDFASQSWQRGPVVLATEERKKAE